MNKKTAPSGCRGLLLALAMIGAPALADPIALAPALAGQYQAGNGVDATFLKIYDSWHGSTVLWNETTKTYGNGAPIGSFADWGSGLWGIADWQTANHHPTADMIEGSWSGRVAQISWGDAAYNSLYGATWGNVDLAPLFSGTGSQNNWTSHFSGYIRITETGLYNFGVLFDDGFFFKLHGADGTLEISQEFLNARDRVGFDNDLSLSEGLYGFELGVYERFEVGVVQLAWKRGGEEWTVVPTENLVASVPEPGSLALMAGGLLMLAALRRNRGDV